MPRLDLWRFFQFYGCSFENEPRFLLTSVTNSAAYLMHPLLSKIVEHLQSRRKGGADDMSDVINECATAGFPTGIIIAGISQVYLIPHGEAKRLVMKHLFSDKAQAELDKFHSMLEEALCDPND